jgi:hypothetical protein
MRHFLIHWSICMLLHVEPAFLYVMSAAGTKIATCRGGTWGGGLEATTHVASSMACIRIRTRPLLRGGTMKQPSIRRETQRDALAHSVYAYNLTWIRNQNVTRNSLNADTAESVFSYYVMADGCWQAFSFSFCTCTVTMALIQICDGVTAYLLLFRNVPSGAVIFHKLVLVWRKHQYRYLFLLCIMK